MKRDMTVITVPFGLGAGRGGSERGPEAILKEGLVKRLRRAGHRVSHREIAIGTNERSASLRQEAVSAITGFMKNGEEAARASAALARETADVAGRGGFPLMVGGDHSLAIGSLAGLASRFSRLGVIWFDAHPDLNTEETSPSGNMHGISLAVAIGRAKLKLADLWPGAGCVAPEHAVLVCARDVDPAERELIRSAGIRCFPMEAIARHGIERVMLEAVRIAASGTDGLHLSFDIDSIDPSLAPGTGTPVQGGIVLREARAAFGVLRRSGKLTSMDVVEVNPALDDPDQRTSRLAARLVAELFGG